jgi:hypothetical protein
MFCLSLLEPSDELPKKTEQFSRPRWDQGGEKRMRPEKPQSDKDSNEVEWEGQRQLTPPQELQ